MIGSLRQIALAFSLACLSALGACAPDVEQPAGPVVLAASSLQDVMDDAAASWAAQGHQAPQLSFAASSALARQIESGAPADIFVSADLEWMDHVADMGLIRPDSRIVVASNALVLIAPKSAGVAALPADGDLKAIISGLGDGHIAMGEPDSVPAGRYGKQALQQLGLWQDVQDHVAPAENVRAALALVESGEARLGIVYATDAAASDKVQVRAIFPAASHDAILYPAAVLQEAKGDQGAAFLAFLASDEGQAIFARNGFGPPPR